MKEQLKTWLKSEQNNLDTIIAKSAVTFYKQNKDKSNFQYDLKQCHIENYNLVKGKTYVMIDTILLLLTRFGITQDE